MYSSSLSVGKHTQYALSEWCVPTRGLFCMHFLFLCFYQHWLGHRHRAFIPMFLWWSRSPHLSTVPYVLNLTPFSNTTKPWNIEQTVNQIGSNLLSQGHGHGHAIQGLEIRLQHHFQPIGIQYPLSVFVNSMEAFLMYGERDDLTIFIFSSHIHRFVVLKPIKPPSVDRLSDMKFQYLWIYRGSSPQRNSLTSIITTEPILPYVNTAHAPALYSVIGLRLP